MVIAKFALISSLKVPCRIMAAQMNAMEYTFHVVHSKTGYTSDKQIIVTHAAMQAFPLVCNTLPITLIAQYTITVLVTKCILFWTKIVDVNPIL